ncbi:protein EXORDIUM-like 5, partial [Momordica charantia]|uniref:Protein EXORDIUM-like 5 n=1 Tax=Momordica charantia TaxID=3673 RepID=A0A6J1CHP3_MOMCH
MKSTKMKHLVEENKARGIDENTPGCTKDQFQMQEREREVKSAKKTQALLAVTSTFPSISLHTHSLLFFIKSFLLTSSSSLSSQTLTMAPPLSLFFFFFFLCSSAAASMAAPAFQTFNTHSSPHFFNPKLPPNSLSSSKKFEGSSDFVKLRYHMGPVLSSSPINIYLIWYGKWSVSQKLLIKDFLLSIDPLRVAPSPSVAEWWRTVSLYTDQTGANVSRSVVIAGEHSDLRLSHGTDLTRLSIQKVIATAVQSAPFPVDHRNGMFLVLTSQDVTMQDFCRAVCGFHYFTFPSMVGYTLPYAWVGHSGKQCPEQCAYPFA